MIYQFGSYTLHTLRDELRRAGELVGVSPQTFQVLRYLVEHRNRVVSRDELLEQCSGGIGDTEPSHRAVSTPSLVFSGLRVTL